MDILLVKSPWTITIIPRGAPLVLIVVVGHDWCCYIFGIWSNSLFGEPLWRLIFGLLQWVPNGDISLLPLVFMEMALLDTLVTSQIWPYILLSSKVTTISTAEALEFNFIKILSGQLLNGHRLFLWKRRFVLRLFHDSIQFPPLLINKVTLFMHSLLYQGLGRGELLWWYDIHVAHTKFLDKLRKLLVLMNFP